MRFTLLILFISIFTSSIHAQLEEIAPSYNPQIRKHLYLQSSNSDNVLNRNGADTLDLPFLDDFSYNGPYPDPINWCDKSVFVNHTFASNPPSIGVATMDGLAQSGSPYNSTGQGDTLTSSPFYLGNFSEMDQVYLSFFYQAKGLGDRPELGDSLILEFKDLNEEWINANSFAGIDPSQPNSYIPDFVFYSNLIPSEYLYDGFQFRFRNISSGKGQVDLWHLDYIRLTSFFEPTENFNDVAFTEQPSSFLSRYSAMPWRQFSGFESTEMSDSYTLTLFNHFPVTQEIQNRKYIVSNEADEYLNTNFYTDIALANIPAGTHVENTQTISTADYNTFVSNMGAAPDAEKYIFKSQFSFTQTGQDPAFPASFENDVISRNTVFDNYFAYDDGTAESNIIAQNPGTEVAVQFHLNQADSIKAIQMNIPHVSVDASLQLFNLKVYLDLNDEPIYAANFQSPVYVDQYTATDTLQGMTTYILKDVLGDAAPILLPPGDFYIAWQQVSETDNPIPIGFDKNTPNAGQYNFFNAGGGWEAFPSSSQGAILLRPVIGNGILYNTPIQELNADESFDIYPNPANEILIFKNKSDFNFQGDIEIIDISGKILLRSEFMEFIPVVQLANGMYFVKIREWETGLVYNKKIIIQH